MARPTNIATPPSTAANPTNISVPVRGTKYESGLVGGEMVISIPQASDAGADLTDSVRQEFTAPFKFRIRKVVYSCLNVTGSTTFDLYNATQTAAIIAATALTDGVAGTVTSITTPTVNEDDVIELRITTAASTGECDGLVTWLFVDQLEGSTDNPVGG